MTFDQNNNIVKLCIQGMNCEGEGKTDEAKFLFEKAWKESTNNFEKFTSAHYVARHQKNVSDKLKWDEIALKFALIINDETIKGSLPSLYLNIAKGYEDLNDLTKAKENYTLALSFSGLLLDDGYGKMIKSGIENGLKRIKELEKNLSKDN